MASVMTARPRRTPPWSDRPRASVQRGSSEHSRFTSLPYCGHARRRADGKRAERGDGTRLCRESRLFDRAVSVVTVMETSRGCSSYSAPLRRWLNLPPHHRALGGLRESPAEGFRGQLTLSGKVALAPEPDSPSTTAETFRGWIWKDVPRRSGGLGARLREHQANATHEEAEAVSASRPVHSGRLGALGARAQRADGGPRRWTPRCSEAPTGSSPGAARTRATWSKRRLATSLAFATLFFGGAAFSAGAGDVVAEAIEGGGDGEVAAEEAGRATAAEEESGNGGEGGAGDAPAEARNSPPRVKASRPKTRTPAGTAASPPTTAETADPAARGPRRRGRQNPGDGDGGQNPSDEDGGQNPGGGDSSGDGGGRRRAASASGRRQRGRRRPRLHPTRAIERHPDDPSPPVVLPVVDTATARPRVPRPRADADGFFATVWLPPAC